MNSERIKLKGITWNHSRGLLPMVATAQRYREINPHIEIDWSVRTLQEFADKPIHEMISSFDLLIIDHPWMGYVSKSKDLVPLDHYLSDEFLNEQAENSVGLSFQSYSYNGHQWALPVDTAAPVASSRPDLFKKNDLKLPNNYNELLELCKEGLVAFPAIPIDTLMNFYMFCIAFGEEPFLRNDQVISKRVGIEVLDVMSELARYIDPECFDCNPIRIYEKMSQTDEIAYCPFAYGYANYARRFYSSKILKFHGLISFRNTDKLRSTLGGAGLAVSAASKHVKEACDYAGYVAAAETQQSIYAESGGQPGHRRAWISEYVNEMYGNYFKDTLAVLERSFLRPRYDGYAHFQDHAGNPIREFMMEGGESQTVLQKINQLYKESIQ